MFVTLASSLLIIRTVVGGSPLLPVYPGQIQAKCLGMAVEIFDGTTEPPSRITAAGVTGELVCTRPFPSQPLKFWGNNGTATYQRSYFKPFGDRVWCQGDLVQNCEGTGGLIILGRRYVELVARDIRTSQD